MLARHQGRASDPPLLVLRAEGGPGRGAGHQARCLALAQAWVARKGACVLVADVVAPPWDERYRGAGVQVAAPGSPLPGEVAWWLVDGYDLDGADAPTGARVARIDDHGRSPGGPVDVVLDQNLGATGDPYRGRAGAVLLGTRYALLRQDLVEAAVGRGSVDRARLGHPPLVVVAMGGAPSTDVRVALDQVAVALAAGDVRVHALRGGDDPAPAYAAADAAVAAAGSTCWELGLFGVPSVLVSVADNQEPLGAALAARGAARYLGRLEALAPEVVADEVRALLADGAGRAAQAEAMAGLVDGRGAARVATRLRGDLVALRPVEADDVRLVHELNDDPAARAVSRSTDPIPWDDHQRWFAARLEDPNSHLYVGTDPVGDLVGLVRFAVEGEVAEVSVVVAGPRRGQGWGGPLIDAGVRRLWADRSVPVDGELRVDAFVRPDHHASIAAFLDADFDPAPSGDEGWLRYARRHVGGTHG